MLLKTAVIVYKAYNNSLPMIIQKLFTLYDSVCSIFKEKFARTNLKSMCISVKIIKLWNSHDGSLMCGRSVHYFKNKYTDDILKSYVVNV